MACWNIAHRGGAKLYPENTLAAFAGAISQGCDGAELDVQLSRDGEVVVFHDHALKPAICRGSDGAWISGAGPLIKDLTLAELQSFDVGRADPGSEYARSHGDVSPRDGERIPTLAEVIALAKGAGRPFKLFVELKSCFSDRARSAPPDVLAEATLAVLRAHDYLEHTVLVGFDWPGLLHAKRLERSLQCWFTTMAGSWFRDAPIPDVDAPPSSNALAALRYWADTGRSPWAAGYDAVNYGGSIIRAIKAAGGDGWFAYHRDASDAAVREARQYDLKVGAWTVDDPGEMSALQARGLDAICTDRPDLMERIAGG